VFLEGKRSVPLAGGRSRFSWGGQFFHIFAYVEKVLDGVPLKLQFRFLSLGGFGGGGVLGFLFFSFWGFYFLGGRVCGCCMVGFGVLGCFFFFFFVCCLMGHVRGPGRG